MQAHQLSDVVFRIHEASDRITKSFRPEVFAILREQLNFDSGVWASGTHAPHRLNSVYLHNQPQMLITLYEKEFLFKQDFVRQAAIDQPGKAVRLSELKSRKEFEAMLTYKILCRPLGIEQAIAFAQINRSTGLYEYIALWRNDPCQAFSEADANAMELLCPHMFLGEQRLFSAALRCSSAVDRIRNHALFDSSGVLLVVDAQVVQHLRASWPGWRGPLIPESILQAALENNKPHNFFAPDKRRYTVEPYQCPTMGAAFKLSMLYDPDLTALSLRETQVAELYAQGLSYKEIALALGSAPATVRNQCTAVFRKLGVNNKAELALRIGL